MSLLDRRRGRHFDATDVVVATRYGRRRWRFQAAVKPL
jgi:ribosomal protein L16 Arg81 hydroxylase